MQLEHTIPGRTAPTYQSGEWRFSSTGLVQVRLSLPDGVKPVAKELTDLPEGPNFRPHRLVINLALVQAEDQNTPVTQARFTLRIRVRPADSASLLNHDRLALAYYENDAWVLLNPTPDPNDPNYLQLELESWPADPAIGIGSR